MHLCQHNTSTYCDQSEACCPSHCGSENNNSVRSQSAPLWKLDSVLTVWASLSNHTLSVGTIEFLHHQSGKPLNNVCHSIRVHRTQCTPLWTQQWKAPVEESLVSVMGSDFGLAAGRCYNWMVWMVKTTFLPIPWFLSSYMCLHSWVKSPPPLPLSPSPRALHSVLLHYSGNYHHVHPAAIQLLRNVNNTATCSSAAEHFSNSQGFVFILEQLKPADWK